MLTYDVYLKKRLTEIDVIITQLVQRDSFSMYDWLNIFASIEDDLEIRKALKVESEMILDTGMDNLLEYVSEKIRNEVYLDGSAALLRQILANGSAEMVLTANEIDVLEHGFTGVNSDLEISAAILDYIVGYSFGKLSSDMEIFVDEFDTLKKTYEKFDETLVIDTDSEFASLKTVDLDELSMFLDVAPTDIFYLLTIAGNVTTLLYANSLGDYTLNKVLHDLESKIMLYATNEEEFHLIKSAEMDSTFNIFTELIETIMQYIQPTNADIYLDCEASAGLKRYRKLKELKGHPLRDYNGMSLWDFYYIVIED